MEEQYNSILFFNDSIYLLKFVNDLLNRAPTEENFKYFAKLIAYIERDGQAKMDASTGINGEINYTELQMTSRFIAAAHNFLINLASKKYPGREFEFRVMAEEMIQQVNMSSEEDPLLINHSTEDVIEVHEELNPFKVEDNTEGMKEYYEHRFSSKPAESDKPLIENPQNQMDEYYNARFRTTDTSVSPEMETGGRSRR